MQKFCCFFVWILLFGLLPGCKIDEKHIQLNPPEKEWIAQNPVVDVYLLRTRPSLNMKNSEIRFRGIEFYYLKHIERQTGLRFNFILQPSAQEWQNNLAAGKASMVASVNQDTIGELNLHKNYYFTQPYSTQSIMVISRSDHKPTYNIHDLNGQKVAFIFNHNSHLWLKNDNLNVSFLNVDTPTMALRALVDKKADIALVPETYARFMLNYRFPELTSVGFMPGYYAIYRFGINKKQPLLYGIIQKAMDNMTAESVDDIRKNWENKIATRPTAYSITRAYTREASILLIAILLLLWAVRRANLLMRKAQMGEAAKSEFLAVISHEIRTPMNAIIAAGELLQTMPMNEKQHKLVVQSNLAANSLLQLLNNILDTSRLEAGHERLELSFVEVSPLLDSLAKLYGLAAEVKGVKLLYINDLPSRTLLLDASQLQRVLHNLLSNALKFTEQGTIQLLASFTPEPSNQEKGVFTCSVIDTGIGIPPDVQRRVFSPFVQADSSITRRFGGSGLGLTICKSLLELMKGKITLSSDGHSGTTFTIQIPTRLGETICETESNTSSPHSPVYHGHGQRVLVIEDHPANHLLIQQQLQELGCEVFIASNGMSGLSLLRELSGVQLILLDCHLPDVDGYEVAQRIRKDEQASGSPLIPIIAISAANDDQHKEKCLNAGMNGFLVKPLKMAELQHILEIWLTDTQPYEESSASLPLPNLWKLFCEYNEEDYALILAATKEQNWRIAQQHTHRIYGAALSMEVQPLAEVAGHLEQRLKEQRWDELEPILSQLRSTLDNLIEEPSVRE